VRRFHLDGDQRVYFLGRYTLWSVGGSNLIRRKRKFGTICLCILTPTLLVQKTEELEESDGDMAL
jgi:hypothetical protein